MSVPGPSFVWRREAPWLLAAATIAIVARACALPHVVAYFHSDSAIGSLMAKHIATGTGFPLYYYGQKYVGSLDMVLAAPWYHLYPDDPRGFAIAMSLVFLATLPLVHRILFLCGSVAGARMATILFAIGTPWLVMLSTGHQFAYLSTLTLGCAIQLAGLATLARPSRGGLFATGALMGFGWWNNPQVALYVAPVALAAWSRGNLFTARDPRAPALPRRTDLALRVLGVATACAGVAIAVVVALTFRDTPLTFELGPWHVSLTRPTHYLLKLVAVLAALALAAELLLARERAAWVCAIAILGLGFALGHAPALYDKVAPTTIGRGAPMGIDPSRVMRNLPSLAEESVGVVMGEGTHLASLPEPARTAHAWMARAIGILALLGVAALVVTHRRALARFVQMREVELPFALLLAAQAAALAVLYLCRQDLARRYWIHLWIPACGLAAWGIGRIWERSRWGAVAIAALVYLHHGIGLAHWLRGLPAMVPRHQEALVRYVDAHGMTVGRASYFLAYKTSYLSGERVRFACWTPHHDRIPEHVAAVHDAERRGERVLALFGAFPVGDEEAHVTEEDRPFLARYLAEARAQPLERARVGPFLLFR